MARPFRYDSALGADEEYGNVLLAERGCDRRDEIFRPINVDRGNALRMS
jgi:hypothetical protein